MKDLKRNYNRIEVDYSAVFGSRLKALRQERGLSQKQVAAELGVNVSTYANWEQGRREPSIEDIFRIVEFCGADACELFESVTK